MRQKRPLLNISIGCLVLLALFSSSGIHEVEHNLCLRWASLPACQDNISDKAVLRNPATERCTACFLNRLLNQCIFPTFEKPVIKEFFCNMIFPSRKTLPAPILGNAVPRGPPAGFSQVIGL
jgi:hypothetical protein